jgi:hypothetical protein
MLALPETEPTVVAVVVTRTISAPPDDGVPVFGIAELAGIAHPRPRTTRLAGRPARRHRHGGPRRRRPVITA